MRGFFIPHAINPDMSQVIDDATSTMNDAYDDASTLLDDDGDGLPSPESRTDSRSALPRGFRAWRWLRIVKRDEFFSLVFFSLKAKI